MQRRKNNFVTELLCRKCRLTGRSETECDFENPREGWVFFGVQPAFAQEPAPRISMVLANAGPVIQGPEAMRFLPAGPHRLTLSADTAGAVTLTVRVVPELIFTRFGYNPQIAAYGPYDEAFLSQHVLPNINCMIGKGYDEEKPFLERWKKEGKRWIVESQIPGMSDPPETVTADRAYESWAANPGLLDAIYDGIIADEVGPNQPLQKLSAWTAAIRRLHETGRLKDKSLYAYCYYVLPSQEEGRQFVRALIDCGGRIAWERYLLEQPTEKKAREFLDKTLKQEFLEWERAVPGCRESMIFTLGCHTLMPVESLNVRPDVDWKVFMDMQMHLLANDPAFTCIYGLQTYTCGYADEESVRWASRLFRHYAIEGRTDMLSPRYGYTYNLDYIRNPDFDQGTDHWLIEAAEPDSVSVRHVPGYGHLQGRFLTPDVGDHCLWTRRSRDKRNVIRQEIRNLVPGRLYSFKLITADFGEIRAGRSRQQEHAISVRMENVDLLPEKSLLEVRPSFYTFKMGPFNAENPLWLNFRHQVFRALETSARLALSDWESDGVAGGQVGQELVWNFIEIQPYFQDQTGHRVQLGCISG